MCRTWGVYLCFTLLGSLSSTAQSWEWFAQSGGPGSVVNRNIHVDKEKNVYTCGHLSDSALFGTEMISTSANWAVYIAKYDSMGSHQWVFSAGDTGNNSASAVAADNLGNVYLAGFSINDIDFSTDTITDRVHGAYIAKFEEDGDFLWVKEVADIYYATSIVDIVCDDLGNILVCGRFEDSVTFDSEYLISTGSADGYLAKYDAQGDLIWINQLASEGNTYCNALSPDNQGNYFLIGTHWDTTYIGNDTLAGEQGFYLSKFDGSGSYYWNIRLNSSAASPSSGYNVGADNDGNAYCAGLYYGNNVVVGPDTLPVPVGNYSDLLVCKVSSSGEFKWARGFGSSKNEDYPGIAVDLIGNSYTTVEFTDTITFDSLVMIAPSYPYQDVALMNLDSAGNIKWVSQIASTASIYAYNLEVDIDGDCYVGSSIGDTTTFDTVVMVSIGISDEVVVKIDNPSLPVGVKSRGKISKTLILYPNPASDNISLLYELANDYKLSMSIFNTLGEEVLAFKNLPDSPFQFSVDKLGGGLFILRLSHGSEPIGHARFVLK